MKAIKIISGTYGHNIGGSVVAKTPADGAFEVSEETAARLVGLEVAEYVDADIAAEQDASIDPLPEYSEKMNLAQLAEVGKLYGVDTSEAKTRKAAVEMIDAAKAEMDAEAAGGADDENGSNGENGGSGENNTDGDGNDEQPPALQPAAPVQ